MVGRDGDCGWSAIAVCIAVSFFGEGVHPLEKWDDTSLIRDYTREWAIDHGSEVSQFIGPNPSWVVSSTIVVDDVEVREQHDHTGSWREWLDSLHQPGRWLDLPALLCVAAAVDIAFFIVSASQGSLAFYHIGDVHRADQKVAMMALYNSHWVAILPRQDVPFPDWWLRVENSWPNADRILGGLSVSENLKRFFDNMKLRRSKRTLQGGCTLNHRSPPEDVMRVEIL